MAKERKVLCADVNLPYRGIYIYIVMPSTVNQTPGRGVSSHSSHMTHLIRYSLLQYGQCCNSCKSLFFGKNRQIKALFGSGRETVVYNPQEGNSNSGFQGFCLALSLSFFFAFHTSGWAVPGTVLWKKTTRKN